MRFLKRVAPLGQPEGRRGAADSGGRGRGGPSGRLQTEREVKFILFSITSCPHLEGMFGSDLELMLESPSWAGAGLGPGSPVALAGEAGVEPELSMEEEDCSTAVLSHGATSCFKQCLTKPQLFIFTL